MEKITQKLIDALDIVLFMDACDIKKLSRKQRKELKKKRSEIQEKYWSEKQKQLLDIIEEYQKIKNETHSTS